VFDVVAHLEKWSCRAEQLLTEIEAESKTGPPGNGLASDVLDSEEVQEAARALTAAAGRARDRTLRRAREEPPLPTGRA
jgi:hypothetical protein